MKILKAIEGHIKDDFPYFFMPFTAYSALFNFFQIVSILLITNSQLLTFHTTKEAKNFLVRKSDKKIDLSTKEGCHSFMHQGLTN